jgi:hypothetical protein
MSSCNVFNRLLFLVQSGSHMEVTDTNERALLKDKKTEKNEKTFLNEIVEQ